MVIQSLMYKDYLTPHSWPGKNEGHSSSLASKKKAEHSPNNYNLS